MDLIKEIIISRGGIFIEDIKKDNRIYIKLICENGHEIIKRNDSFKKTWCNKCQHNSIKDAHNLATKKGFKFLSNEFKTCNDSYLWECSQGHQWMAKYGNIHAGKGCPKCLLVPFSYYTELITKKGGSMITLEHEYKKVRSKIKFKCKEGHICETTGICLRMNCWCLECNMSLCERTCRKIFEYIFKKPFSKSRHLKNPETNRGLELDGYNEELKIAFEYNGAQHYRKIDYWQTDETFKDQQNRDILTQKLCKENNIKLVIIPYTVKYEDLYTFIINYFPEYNFEKTIDYDILKLESYNEDRLDEIRKTIEKYKGTLLTGFYINNTTKMDFLCVNGHKFKTTWGLIQQGFFCKKCTGDRISNKTLPKIKEYCEKYDFELLSTYTKAKDNLLWKCTKCNKEFERSWDGLSRVSKTHYNCKGIKD